MVKFLAWEAFILWEQNFQLKIVTHERKLLAKTCCSILYRTPGHIFCDKTFFVATDVTMLVIVLLKFYQAWYSILFIGNLAWVNVFSLDAPSSTFIACMHCSQSVLFAAFSWITRSFMAIIFILESGTGGYLFWFELNDGGSRVGSFSPLCQPESSLLSMQKCNLLTSSKIFNYFNVLLRWWPANIVKKLVWILLGSHVYGRSILVIGAHITKFLSFSRWKYRCSYLLKNDFPWLDNAKRRQDTNSKTSSRLNTKPQLGFASIL